MASLAAIETKLRRLFTQPKKGELLELRAGLVLQYPHERKEAIQRVIAAMTVGKDVSLLFPDVLKNIATHDIEQKKLVYLYFMNYAKLHPELVILAVNTFVKDTEDPNPLVRALAIRTMGCIRVDRMVDYMELPLQRTLTDDNPYVRKTAAVCVAKLFDLSPQVCVDGGFVEQLHKLIDDLNPMVVANAVSALADIQDMSPAQALFVVTPRILKRLMLALNECTEWGRIAILTALAEYTATSYDEAAHIIERVIPQLQHANAAVVLAAVRAVCAHVERVSSNREVYSGYLAKLSLPLVALMLSLPEAQYVGIRNIRIVLEQYPQVLAREMRVFYVKYLDPLYLKLEKLEILVRLSSAKNAGLLLAELSEYALEVEPEFVRRAVAAIGQVATKLGDPHAYKCVEALVRLVEQRGELVASEAVKVCRDIARAFGTTPMYVDAIAPCVALVEYDTLEDPGAQAAYVWMAGEFPQHFGQWSPLFDDAPAVVQLAILSAQTKVHLKRGESAGLSALLEKGTTAQSPDVRDRAYLYWRLLSANPAAARQVVVGGSIPPVPSTIAKLPPALLAELIAELGSVASVYHRPAAVFVSGEQARRVKVDNMEKLEELAETEGKRTETLLDLSDGEGEPEAPVSTSAGNDLLGLF